MQPLIAINGRFLTKSVTGVERYALEICQALLRRGARLKFIVLAPRGELKQRLPGLVQDDSPLQGHAWEQLRLPLMARRLGARVLWCPCNTAPVLLPVKSLVASIHDASVFAGPEWFNPKFRFLYRWLLPAIGRRAQRIITVSKFSKQELTRYRIVTDPGKVRVVGEGISSLIQNHQGQARKPDEGFSGLTGERQRYVLALGSINPRKNFERLMLAWKQLPESIKQGRRLLVAGDIQRCFRTSGFAVDADDVAYLGYVSDEEALNLYRGADAFVYPSLYEGFGLPPLEAMACGAPVMVSHAASLPEVCGDAALYCDPFDIEDITRKLAQILTDDTLRRELVLKGFQQAKKFSWEDAAGQLLSVFDELIDKERNNT
jgi:glycosyltransferase involved in cell wall biosynthesis